MASASRSAEKKKENIEADDIRFKEELANAPKPQTAEEKAKDGIRRARMIQQRTGGKTILADRYGGATETKSLLGE